MALRAVVLAGTAAGLAACSGSGLETAMKDPMEGLIGDSDPMVALGLRADPNAEEIEYRPRSPLVVPKDDAALPPPQQRAEGYGADWPQDPDEARRQKLREARAAASAETTKDVENASTAMTPEQLRDWSRSTGGHGVASGGSYEPAGIETSRPVSPRDLLDRKKDPNARLSRAEPAREDLTDPPPGYRTPAANPDGTIPATEPKKKKNFFARLFGE